MIRVEVAEDVAAELIDMETTVTDLMRRTAEKSKRGLQKLLLTPGENATWRWPRHCARRKKPPPGPLMPDFNVIWT